ncbi:hypothetical protein [Spongiivirga citrea]|uniref:Uncharacterized protein n=1 Tax=Spongiivirga citrea TaxID=1481457 RepID=A0A6M0CK01_9FLAO|nr:hypothetical protein [Spongiivirga citrea]NER18276.1 hypothetical protein [Spongiivirga citrea]
MKKELKVTEFSRKKHLLEFANANANKLEIVSITTSQSSGSYQHFLWYYEV